MRAIGGWWTAVVLTACTTAPDRPMAVYDADSDRLFDLPWPSDARREADGTIDVSLFPNPGDKALISSYLAIGDGLDGFGTNSPMHLTLTGPIAPEDLPTSAQSLRPGSPILLFDVDPRSPHRGERVPVVSRLQREPTNYQPANLLTIAPEWGFPLRPGTEYALVITTDLLRPNPAFTAELTGKPYEDLVAGLLDQGLGLPDVAIATSFTTYEPQAELAFIAGWMKTHIEPPVLDQHVPLLGSCLYYSVYQGHYEGPVFTHGERPYAVSGGGFRYRDDGAPLIASWDDMRMAITVPNRPAPPGGWPVVIWEDGTGSDFLSGARSQSAMEVASVLARAGWASIGLDLPLHGTRQGTTPASDLQSFNLLNPESGITNFRQGALDLIYLARALARAPVVLTNDFDEQVVLDTSQLAFFGHSQGALHGDLAGPYMSEWVDGMALSGTGAVLSITVEQRTDPLDFAALVVDLADFDPDEVPDRFHPVFGLVQWLAEVTDPGNYAPYWYRERTGDPGQRSLDVLMLHGTADTATPVETAMDLACAAGAPQLWPQATDSACLGVRGLLPERGPLVGNVDGFDGPATAALVQWPDGSHGIAFRDPEMTRVYEEFFESLRTGDTTIVLR